MTETTEPTKPKLSVEQAKLLRDAMERLRDKQTELKRMNSGTLPGSLGNILNQMKGAENGNRSSVGRE